MNYRSGKLVSIIMNCFNGAEFLEKSINSIKKQTYENWEIIFWDNKSTDASKEIFKKCGNGDKRFKYFISNKHTSLGEARNLAISKAKGEYIAFLDCDDLWMPDKLAKQLPHFNNQNVGMVICDTVFFNSKKDIKQLYKRKKPPSGFVLRELLADYFISLETVVIKREYINKMTHIFDEKFHVIEEYDFFIRYLMNCEMVYVDKVLSKWRVHQKSWTWSRPDLFPTELKIFLKKITSECPNIIIEYAEEIQALDSRIQMLDGIQLWACGDSLSARKIFRKFINRKYAILYFCSFFNYKYYKFINNIRLGLSS